MLALVTHDAASAASLLVALSYALGQLLPLLSDRVNKRAVRLKKAGREQSK